MITKMGGQFQAPTVPRSQMLESFGITWHRLNLPRRPFGLELKARCELFHRYISFVTVFALKDVLERHCHAAWKKQNTSKSVQSHLLLCASN